MMDADVIKSYLMQLGFTIDSAGYDKFKRVLDDINRKVQEVTVGMTKNYVKAGFEIVGAISLISTAIVGLMNKVAQTDLEYQKFALHMYMSKEQAMKLKIATDALGESLEDIAWNPELRQRYMELTKQLDRMKEPSGFEERMKQIRDFRFEFTRLKVEGIWATRLLADALFKYLEKPLIATKDGLKSINELIMQNLPMWLDSVGSFLSKVVDLAITLGRIVKDIVKPWTDMYKMLTESQRAIVLFTAAFTALAFVVKMSPIGRFITLLTILVALIDDFYAYIDGRKSNKVLAPIWDDLIWALDKVVRLAVAGMVAIEHLWAKMQGKKMAKGFLDDMKDAWNSVEGLAKKPDKGREVSEYEVTSLKAKIAKGATPAEVQREGEFGGEVAAYGYISPETGRGGKYQIRTEDWSKWSREAVAAGVMKDGTLTAANQEALVSFKLRQFMQIYGGDEKAAMAALAGNPPPIPSPVSALPPGVGIPLGRPPSPFRGLRGLGNLFDYDLNTQIATGKKEDRASGTSFSDRVGNAVDWLKQRIGMKESGGQKDPYSAVGPETGRGRAYGKYQFMQSSWKDWSKKWLGNENAPMTPENQEYVASKQMEYYLNKYKGNMQLASAAWVSGEAAADRLAKGDTSILGKSVGGGLKETVGDYVYGTTGQRMGGQGETKVDVGGVNVNITEPGASAEEVWLKTMKGVEDGVRSALDKRTAMALRDFEGVNAR